MPWWFVLSNYGRSHVWNHEFFLRKLFSATFCCLLQIKQRCRGSRSASSEEEEEKYEVPKMVLYISSFLFRFIIISLKSSNQGQSIGQKIPPCRQGQKSKGQRNSITNIKSNSRISLEIPSSLFSVKMLLVKDGKVFLTPSKNLWLSKYVKGNWSLMDLKWPQIWS